MHIIELYVIWESKLFIIVVFKGTENGTSQRGLLFKTLKPTWCINITLIMKLSRNEFFIIESVGKFKTGK